MISELFQKGDTVVVNVPQENREGGYNPCPNGTVGTIVSFGEIEYGWTDNFGREPGIYENKSWINVQFPNKQIHNIGSFCLELGNAEVAEARRQAWFALGDARWDEKNRLRDLPETKFYPGDVVSHPRYPEYAEMVIARIHYQYIGQKRTDGSDMPLYDISDKFRAGWHTSADENHLTFIRRGNVWKFYHKEPMTFASLEEEAMLATILGQTDDIRNPANGIYKWSKDEVLDAIEKGLAHGLELSGGMFGGGPIDRAIRFHNEDLGKRVAATTLKGFGRYMPECEARQDMTSEGGIAND